MVNVAAHVAEGPRWSSIVLFRPCVAVRRLLLVTDAVELDGPEAARLSAPYDK